MRYLQVYLFTIMWCLQLTAKNSKLCIRRILNCPHTYLATLLRPCYDPGRSTVAIDVAGTQRSRSEEPKDAQCRRPSATILNMHKKVAELCDCAESWLGRRGIAVESP